jgi:hypothetical protein
MKGIFIGYSESSKSYRIYVLGQKKVEISRDMTFDEKVSFKKFIEDSMYSNDEEEHEGPKEETTCSPKHPNEDPKQPLESMKPVIVPETRKKKKDIKLLVAPSRRARGPKYSLVIQHP